MYNEGFRTELYVDDLPLYTLEYQLYLVALSETDNVPNATDLPVKFFLMGGPALLMKGS